MADSPQPASPPPVHETHPRSARRRSNAWLVAVIILFVAVILGRNHIRAWWWAWRLTGATSREDSAYYVASLMALRETGLAPARWLAHRPSAESRGSTLIILNALPIELTLPVFEDLMSDADLSIRESAALSLAFNGTPPAVNALVRRAESAQSGADEATAALGRAGSAVAAEALVRILHSHRDPAIRAQAAEAMTDMLAARLNRMDGDPPMPAGFSRSSSTAGASDMAEPLVKALVQALDDDATFKGLLATERQVAAVAAQMTIPVQFDEASGAGTTSDSTRSVASVASDGLFRLTGLRTNPAGPADAAERAQLADRVLEKWRERTRPRQ